PETEFKREQKQTLQSILTREDRPSGLVSELFARTLYPNHPCGFPLIGEVASVEALTPETLHAYHQRHLHPARLHLAVVGAVEANHGVRLPGRAFAARGATPPPLPELLPPGPLAGPGRTDRALEKAQTHLMLGFRGARVGDSWRFALEVLSNVLSG